MRGSLRSLIREIFNDSFSKVDGVVIVSLWAPMLVRRSFPVGMVFDVDFEVPKVATERSGEHHGLDD